MAWNMPSLEPDHTVGVRPGVDVLPWLARRYATYVSRPGVPVGRKSKPKSSALTKVGDELANVPKTSSRLPTAPAFRRGRSRKLPGGTALSSLVRSPRK